jgi:5-methylcytosine-specific restriction enzyme B
MPAAELSFDRIRELYDLYRKANPWPEWLAAFRNELELRERADDAFTRPDTQERLWRARGISGIGPGEAVDTRGAYTDGDVIQAFLGLRRGPWPKEDNARAQAMQGAYDRILNLVHPKHASSRPQAKLARAFTLLLPEHTHTAFSWQSRRNVQALLVGARRVGPIESAVLSRARLRSALDEESDISEHVRRATFCWWLHERFETISRGEDPTVGGPLAPPVADETEVAPPLVPWPIMKQRKGLGAVTGYTDSYRAIVAAAQEGATVEDIVDSIRSDDDLAHWNPKMCRAVFHRVRRLGFLENRGGLWHPSPDGERLLEEDPPDVLVEKLLVRSFGLGHVLRSLKLRGPLSRSELNALLRTLYPRWTTDFMPGSIGAWAASLGLVEHDSQDRRVLSSYGKAWEARLPPDLAVPDPAENEFDEVHGAEGQSAPEQSQLGWPTLELMLASFRSDPTLQQLVFSDSQLRTLHVAWHCQPTKRFVLLSGLSGTGKTALLVRYAQTFVRLVGSDPAQHCALVPVAPDWRDPSGLLGYINALHVDPTFQAGPALRLLLRAARNPAQPYFLILDEMNLARVEQYFAPFLSAMEVPDAPFVIHAHDEPINDVPPSIAWPRNLFIGGTVNMDETTYPFSDKVLDRAFTLEFWDVDLPSFLDRRATTGAARHAATERLLVEMNDVLKKARRHFGYRTARELLDFLDQAERDVAVDDAVRTGLVDDVVFSKILPRLRGEETPGFHGVLEATGKLCVDHGLVRSASKIGEMVERLRATGVTRFWA